MKAKTKDALIGSACGFAFFAVVMTGAYVIGLPAHSRAIEKRAPKAKVKWDEVYWGHGAPYWIYLTPTPKPK